ncbi:hypothetical protein FY127_22480, partial [Escherichia coli]
QQLTHAALTTMLTRVKYPTLASICLTESHTALPILSQLSLIKQVTSALNLLQCLIGLRPPL